MLLPQQIGRSYASWLAAGFFLSGTQICCRKDWKVLFLDRIQLRSPWLIPEMFLPLGAWIAQLCLLYLDTDASVTQLVYCSSGSAYSTWKPRVLWNLLQIGLSPCSLACFPKPMMNVGMIVCTSQWTTLWSKPCAGIVWQFVGELGFWLGIKVGNLYMKPMGSRTSTWHLLSQGEICGWVKIVLTIWNASQGFAWFTAVCQRVRKELTGM